MMETYFNRPLSGLHDQKHFADIKFTNQIFLGNCLKKISSQQETICHICGKDQTKMDS